MQVRPLEARDQALLWDLLHVALWDPPPAGLRLREVLDRPDVRIYAEAWGREGDVGVLGETAHSAASLDPSSETSDRGSAATRSARAGPSGLGSLRSTEWLTRPIGACWMRRIEGGRGLGYVDDQTPQLGIAVMPSFQRRGYGGQLMRAALAAARAYGYRRVALTVHPENPAIALYERCGFRKLEQRRGYHLMSVEFGPSP